MGSYEPAITAIHYFENLAISINLEEGFQPVSFEVYPNPAKAFIKLDFESTQPISIEIFDATGKKVATYSDVVPHQSIPIRDFSPGIYLLKTQIGEQRISKRFIPVGE